MQWYFSVRSIWVNWQNPAENMSLILRSPLYFIGAELYSFLALDYNGFFCYFNISQYFAYGTIFTNPIFAALSVCAVTSVCFAESNGLKSPLLTHRFGRFVRAVYAALFVALFILVHFTLFVAHRVYSLGFSGVQGRYFIPILPLLILPMLPKRIMNAETSKSIVIGSYCVMLCVLTYPVVMFLAKMCYRIYSGV